MATVRPQHELHGTSTERAAPTWIRIDAPDARSAFALEQRLAHLHPSAVGRGTSWSVELEDFDDRREEIEAGVRRWLRQIGARSTVLSTNGAATTISAEPPVKAALGAGYDGPDVLEHELRQRGRRHEHRCVSPRVQRADHDAAASAARARSTRRT